MVLFSLFIFLVWCIYGCNHTRLKKHIDPQPSLTSIESGYHNNTLEKQSLLNYNKDLPSAKNPWNHYEHIISDLKKQNPAGETLLHILVKKSDDTTLLQLLQYLTAISSKDIKADIQSILSIQDNFTYTPFDIAVIGGHEACVKLLSDYVDIKQLESAMDTLRLYAQPDNPSMIKLLEDIIQNTKLRIAAEKGDTDRFDKILSELLIQDRTDEAYLIQALYGDATPYIETVNNPVINQLSRNNPRIKEALMAENSNRLTLIQHAAQKGYVKIIECTLKYITMDALANMIHLNGCLCSKNVRTQFYTIHNGTTCPPTASDNCNADAINSVSTNHHKTHGKRCIDKTQNISIKHKKTAHK